MTELDNEAIAEPFKELAPALGNTPVAPAHGIAAIALSMAMKWHDISTVQDGTLYQQYKLEGKNMIPLHLDQVFETAERMETWLLGSSQRIAKIVVDAITFGVEGDEQGDGETAETTTPPEAEALNPENRDRDPMTNGDGMPTGLLVVLTAYREFEREDVAWLMDGLKSLDEDEQRKLIAEFRRQIWNVAAQEAWEAAKQTQ